MTSSKQDGSQEEFDWKSVISKKASSHHEISAIDGMCEKCSTWYSAKLADDELQSGQVDISTTESRFKDGPQEESSKHQRRFGPRVIQRISPLVLNSKASQG
jgi:hypothetical protein